MRFISYLSFLFVCATAYEESYSSRKEYGFEKFVVKHVTYVEEAIPENVMVNN